MKKQRESAHQFLIDSWKSVSNAHLKIIEKDDFSLLQSNVSDFYLNAVLSFPQLNDMNLKKIALLNDFFQYNHKKKQNVALWIKKEEFTAYRPFINGFENFGEVKTLTLDLQHFSEHVESSEKVVTQVNTSKDLKLWVSLFQDAFQLSKAGESLFFSLFFDNLGNKKLKHFYLSTDAHICAALTILENDKNEIYLCNFATKLEYRNKGLLTSLLSQVLTKEQKKGIKRVYVHANSLSSGLLNKMKFTQIDGYYFLGVLNHTMQ